MRKGAGTFDGIFLTAIGAGASGVVLIVRGKCL